MNLTGSFESMKSMCAINVYNNDSDDGNNVHTHDICVYSLLNNFVYCN